MEIAKPTRWGEYRGLIGSSTAAAAVFAIVALIVPVPTMAEYCAEILWGAVPSGAAQLSGLYFGTAAMYGLVPIVAGRWLVTGVAYASTWAGPLLFARGLQFPESVPPGLPP